MYDAYNCSFKCYKDFDLHILQWEEVYSNSYKLLMSLHIKLLYMKKEEYILPLYVWEDNNMRWVKLQFHHAINIWPTSSSKKEVLL